MPCDMTSRSVNVSVSIVLLKIQNKQKTIYFKKPSHLPGNTISNQEYYFLFGAVGGVYTHQTT
jgi:hypothetical protein